MNIRLVALNGTGGAFTDILAVIPTRRLEMMEDEATATQGIQVKSVVDSFAQIYTFSFGSEPVTIQHDSSKYAGAGVLLGLPAWNAGNGTSAFNYRAADKLASARSATATTTNLRVLEYE